MEKYIKLFTSISYYAIVKGWNISTIDDIIVLIKDNEEIQNKFEIYAENTIDEVLKELNDIVRKEKIDIATKLNNSINALNDEYDNIKKNEIKFERFCPKDESEQEIKDRMEHNLEVEIEEFSKKYNYDRV